MIAIGASNLLGSFVGSFPVTGSFSRTAINAGSGVRTPLGGIYTGLRYYYGNQLNKKLILTYLIQQELWYCYLLAFLHRTFISSRKVL